MWYVSMVLWGAGGVVVVTFIRILRQVRFIP